MTVISATLSSFTGQGEKGFVRNLADVSPVMELRRRHSLRLEGDQRWRMIVCHRGTVWVTQRNDIEDYVLKSGDMFLISLRGKVVIQALEDARIEITSPLTARPYRGDYAAFA